MFVPLTTENPYPKAAYENDVASGAHISEVRSPDDLKKFFPDDIVTGFDSPGGEAELSGYLNHEGGWAESGRALEVLLERVRAAGGEVLAGKEVSGVMRKGLHITGVACTDGSGYHAATTIVAAGAWTPRLAQHLGIEFTSGLYVQKPEDELAGPEEQEAIGQHVGVGLATG